jgi:large subunit ribosomal protein L14e
MLVTGPKEVTGVRRRRANIDHLVPTKQKVSLKPGADDKAVSKALAEAKLEQFMREATSP